MAKRRSDIQYTFKVNLKGRKSIWRTLMLRGDHTLHDLHETIYEAFERYDEHLYSFYFPKAATGRERIRFKEKEYTSPIAFEEPGLFYDKDTSNAAEAELSSLQLRLGQTFEYVFDFGDNWLHEIKVISIEPIEKTKQSTLPLISERHGKSPEQYPSEEE